MNVTVFQVQIIFLECPCAKTCRLRPPPDALAERLRKEMSHGRDVNRRKVDLSGAAVDMPAGFHDSFQYN